MTKQDAIELFGGTQVLVGRAIGVSKAAISQWPDTLTRSQADRVLGAYFRIHGRMPMGYRSYNARKALSALA